MRNLNVVIISLRGEVLYTDFGLNPQIAMVLTAKSVPKKHPNGVAYGEAWTLYLPLIDS